MIPNKTKPTSFKRPSLHIEREMKDVAVNLSYDENEFIEWMHSHYKIVFFNSQGKLITVSNNSSLHDEYIKQAITPAYITTSGCIMIDLDFTRCRGEHELYSVVMASEYEYDEVVDNDYMINKITPPNASNNKASKGGTSSPLIISLDNELPIHEKKSAHITEIGVNDQNGDNLPIINLTVGQMKNDYLKGTPLGRYNLVVLPSSKMAHTHSGIQSTVGQMYTVNDTIFSSLGIEVASVTFNNGYIGNINNITKMNADIKFRHGRFKSSNIKPEVLEIIELDNCFVDSTETNESADVCAANVTKLAENASLLSKVFIVDCSTLSDTPKPNVLKLTGCNADTYDEVREKGENLKSSGDVLFLMNTI